jgi:large subunit ribosomal protein L11
MEFCKQYNAATEANRGTVIPVEVTIYDDRSFTFVLKTPPTPVLLRQAAGIDKGSNRPGGPAIGRVTKAQILEVARVKLPDLNAYDEEAACRQVEGTARSMGLQIAE